MATKALYKRIFDSIKEDIAARIYDADEQLPTELELTRFFGVSRITVKRALEELELHGYIYRKQGSGSFVKAGHERLQFGERERPGGMIAMLLPSASSSGLSEYIRGASDEADGKGYFLSIHFTNESMDKERELLRQLPKQGFKGIIYYPTSGRATVELYALHMNGYPIVTIDKHCEGLPVGGVSSDNEAGGYAAASELLQMGHTRIAFVSSVGLEAASSVKGRYFGYCRALCEHGIAADAELLRLDFWRQWNEMGEERCFAEIVSGLIRHGATAIQAENDYVAALLIKAAAELGIKVPEQLSLVGFDDSGAGLGASIELTTVAQPFYAIGRKAAESIIAAIETGKAAESAVLPVRLVARGSAAPVPTVSGATVKL